YHEEPTTPHQHPADTPPDSRHSHDTATRRNQPLHAIAEYLHLVYLFDGSTRGIAGPLEDDLKQAVRNWAEAYPRSTLLYWIDDQGRVVIEDQRASWPEEVIELDELQSNVYLDLFQGAGWEGVRRRLADGGQVVTDEEARKILRYFVDRGLAFEDEGRYVSLALEVDPYRRKLVDGREVAASR
ncbi:hypothetical protein ThrDRAFT_04671, partial [Frankia casuarinae]